MVVITHLLDGTIVNPLNAGKLSVDLNFDKDARTAIVGQDMWEFGGEEPRLFLNYVSSGLTGGNGIGEGIPYQIKISDGTTTETPFNGFIDLADDSTIGKDKVSAKSKELARIDFLNDRAPTVVWQLYGDTNSPMYDANFANLNIMCPYIINSIPDYAQSSIAAVSAFIVGTELERSITNLSFLISAIPATDDPETIIMLIAEIVNLVLLILAIVKLVDDLKNLLIQPVKYHSCMKVVDLLNYGFTQLGLTFSSQILTDFPDLQKMVIMPQKFQNPVNSQDKRFLGFTTPNKAKQPAWPTGTLADLLTGLKTMFNAKLLIDFNGNVNMVREDYIPGVPLYQLKTIENRSFKTNFNRITANTLVQFQYDTIDKNTINEFEGTVFQSCITPRTVTDQKKVVLKGETNYNIPWALAKTKKTLTTPENIVKGLLQVVTAILGAVATVVNALLSVLNFLIKLINKIIKALKVVHVNIKFQIPTIPMLPHTNFTNIITNRIGMLMLEHDFTSQAKIFLLDGTPTSKDKFNKPSVNNATILHALWLYNNFQIVNSFMPYQGNPNGNQWIIKNYSNFTFTFNDYLQVKKNNYIKDGYGNICKVVSLKWNVVDQTADAEIWFNQLYTNNIQEIKLLPNAA